MKILAIEKESEDIVWGNEQVTLENEARVVYKLYLDGSIREIYFNENNIAVLILECESICQASELLKTLPLVKKRRITFILMELNPYNGYDRIIKK